MLCEEYLSEIEKSYKEKYLEDADKYSQLLVFKWNEPTPLDDMILAMENVNLDDWDIFGDKFRDWNFYFNSIMHEARYTYTREKNRFISAFSDTLTYDVDSLDLDANDYEHRDKVYETLVCFCFSPMVNFSFSLKISTGAKLWTSTGNRIEKWFS